MLTSFLCQNKPCDETTWKRWRSALSVLREFIYLYQFFPSWFSLIFSEFSKIYFFLICLFFLSLLSNFSFSDSLGEYHRIPITSHPAGNWINILICYNTICCNSVRIDLIIILSWIFIRKTNVSHYFLLLIFLFFFFFISIAFKNN